MRRPSRLLLALAGAYLLPAVVLDARVVRELGNSYGYFDTYAMAVVSAPVGLVTIGLLAGTVPLDWRAAWLAVLVASQCGNVLLARGLFRALRAAVRAVARLARGGQ